MIKKFIQGFSSVLAIISALATLVLMLMTIVDVISRIVTGGSIPGLLEFTEVALVFLVFCGVAYGQQTHTHVSVTLLTSRLPEKAGRTVVVIGMLVMIALFLWATIASGNQAIDSVMRQEARFGLTSVPIWPARLVLPFGFGLLLCETIIQMIAVLKGEEKVREDYTQINEEEIEA